MLQIAETPSSVMYSCFKQFASLGIGEVAGTVFSPAYMYGGAPIHDRFSERTFLTRVIKNAQPGDFPERAFADFPTAAVELCAKVFARHPGPSGRRETIGFFAGEACEAMCESLQAYGLNDILYRNIVSRLDQMELANGADKASLLVLQFVATGCLGDPARATQITQEFSRRILQESFRTQFAHEGEGGGEAELADTSVQLGLCRVIDGKLRMPAYVLSTDPAGTEIGSLSSAEHAINDVDVTVSKRHARVYRDKVGRWFVEGLGSTNGTAVLRGDSRILEVVEPARSERSGAALPPVRIYPSDTLCLADTTQFMVLELA